jgi:hypothetical protein
VTQLYLCLYISVNLADEKARWRRVLFVTKQVEEWAKKYDEDFAEDNLQEEFNKEWSSMSQSEQILSANSVEYRRKCAKGYLLFKYFKEHILVENEFKKIGLSHTGPISDTVQLLKDVENLPNLLKDDDFTNNSFSLLQIMFCQKQKQLLKPA